MAPSDYIFSRDVRASIRLNYQHLAIAQLYGFLLHPSIPTTAVRVADVGTGTALWPIELARQRPNAEIVGFDISDAQFPPAEWLPQNVRLEVQNALESFPECHMAQYDVVHVRFFSTLLNSDEQAKRLIANLSALLKPGGYLQWLDANPPTARAFAHVSSTPKMATERLVALMRKPHPGAFYGWIDHVPDLLRAAQAPVIAHETASCAVFPSSRAIWNQCYLLGYQEFWARLVEDADASSSQSDKAEQAKAEGVALEAEFKAGASMEMDYFCIVAQKTST